MYMSRQRFPLTVRSQCTLNNEHVAVTKKQKCVNLYCKSRNLAIITSVIHNLSIIHEIAIV